MNKEEIINITSKTKNDEMEKSVLSRGYHINSVSLAIGILIIIYLRARKGELFSQDLLFLLMLQISTVSFYQYLKIKNPIYLLAGIIGFIATIMTIINMLSYYGYIQ